MIGRLRKDRPIFLRLSERRTDLRPARRTNVNIDCKLVSRERQAAASVVRIGDSAFGGEAVAVIAGPCSVETHPQMAAAADAVAAAGATLMRGGAFKPRTSPYAFQGKGVEGLAMLKESASRHALPVVTELMDVRMLDTFLAMGVDAIQVGTRNMKNF
jgi:3-deoxy-7-phosphoheptulonate synthase